MYGWDEKYFTYIPLLEKYLARLKPKRILEWGPGHSTRIMITKAPKAEIISYENEAKWFHKRNREFGNKAKIVLAEAPTEDRKQFAWKKYTDPLVEGKFDLIFVDGRERVRCMKTATKLLSKNGVLILHDANRGAYREGIALFDIVERDRNTLCLKRKTSL